MIYLKFLISLLRHKWFVFIAGLRVGGIPLYRLIIHDYSKFSREEFGPYARNFYGARSEEVKLEFAKAWKHHYMENAHHWQFWIRGDAPAAMLEEDLREMIADWFGASRRYTGSWDMEEWLKENLSNIKLHPNTRSKVYEILGEFGYYIYHNKDVVVVKNNGIISSCTQ